MTTDDTVIGGLAAELERAIEGPGEDEEGGGPAATGAAAPQAPAPGTPEDLRSLLEDVRALGVFGLLVAVSDAPEPTEDVHREIPDRVAAKVRAQLEEDRAKLVAEGAPAPEAPPEALAVEGLIRLFHERKGGKSKLVLRKIIENAIFEFYDLRDHALFIDDVARILDVFRSASGATDNAQAFMKKLAALSSDTAKFMLGLFPEQINLIYKVTRREAERAEIDAAFDMFAPKVIWKRVFAILKSLLQKEKRFRLAFTVWARLRGVAISREQMAKLETYLAVKDTRDLVKRALARAAERRRLLDFMRAHAASLAALEDSF